MKKAPIAKAIMITLGSSQLKEHGYRKYVNDFEKCDGENGCWFYKMKNLPKREFQEVWLVIGGYVRWKANILGKETDMYVEYWSGEIDDHFSGIVLFDFKKQPKPYQKVKGFQGFRYVEF